MDQTLRPYADQTAPRYTSYPTAPHFTDQVDGETVRGWLAALPPDADLTLYLHVPFCRDICWYCGCHTVATRKDAPVLDYAATLMREVALAAQSTRARRVKAIHWGGGTPNILTPAAFRALAAELRDRFDLSGLEEHAIELDPRTLTLDQIAAFAEAGVTRASLGVQDLNAHVQASIGRVQPYEVVAAAVERLRHGGVDKINLDLMYGLPNQTVADAIRSAELAAELAPNRLAAFGYAHVPWFKTRQRLIAEPSLPDAETRFDQAEAIRDTLAAHGYRAIGFDHYARADDALAAAADDGRLGRSFQGYEEARADALIGFGASAISTYPDGYAQNAPDIAGWSRAVLAGRLPTVRGRAVTADDRVRRDIIERLLCAFEADVAQDGGLAAFPGAEEALAPLAADGLVALEGDRVRVTPKGRPFARLAAQAFDAYRAGSAARHSVAV